MPLSSPSRRSLLAAGAWSVPAVAVVTSAPAYATSVPPQVCAAALTHVTNWNTSEPSFKAKVDTGWYDRALFMPDGHTGPHDNVTVANRAWYMGLHTPGEELPTGSFLSFANNPSSTVEQQITIEWTFNVTGRATLDVNGMIMFGYGNHTGGRTARQLVDIYVDGLAVPRTTPIAQLAAARTDGNGNYFPNRDVAPGVAVSDKSVYDQLESDPSLEARGYTLHQPPAESDQGRFDAPYIADRIIDEETAPRALVVRMILTLPPVPVPAGTGQDDWVNDDIIVYPPVVTTAC